MEADEAPQNESQPGNEGLVLQNRTNPITHMYFDPGSQPTIVNTAEHLNIRKSTQGNANRVSQDNGEEKRILKEFFNYVNEVTRKKSESTIAKEHFIGEIDEPTEVTPLLAITNHFRGESALDEVDYSVTKERGRKAVTKRAREVQVSLPDVHKHGRYIMLIGGAGSGKTTLIKRYCKMVLEKKIENMKQIEVVHLVNIRDLWRKDITPKDMLFDRFIVGDEKKDAISFGYKWMQREENQEKVLFAFDGIDTATWSLSDETHAIINYDNVCSAEIIMYNILYGHLFPKCKLLLTSREYGISKFPRQIRPNKIIALKGLTRESIRILVKDLGGEKGDHIWRTMLQKSLNLMLLCSTPLFLIFTILVYKEYGDPPENLSGIIITILEHHIHSESRRVDEKKVREIIEKLKKLSRLGLGRGTVIFSKKEFDDLKLDLDDIKDLVISAPAPKGVGYPRLMEEDYTYFFCHQAVQEALAGLCIADEEFEEFRKFVDDYLHLPKCIMVRQILCGVIFNSETPILTQTQAKIRDHQRKKDYLLFSLAEELQKGNDMLNLLISLRECGDEAGIGEMIKQKIHKISLTGIPLTPSDMHAVAVVTKRCDYLDIMQLVNCQLDKYSLQVLVNGMKDSNVMITVFDVSFNRNLRKDSMYYVHKVCIRGQGLNYWQCGFRQGDILDFDEQKTEPRTTEAIEMPEEDVIRRSYNEDGVLDLACYNVENHAHLLKTLVARNDPGGNGLRLSLLEYELSSDVTTLCEILGNCCDIKELAISESQLKETQINKIRNAIQGKQIDALNIFLTPNIEERGWEALGKIGETCQVKDVFITACSLTDRKLQNLKFSLCDTTLHKLDISRNGDMNEYCLSEIGEIVKQCKVEELVMGYCKFKAEHMEFLNQRISGAKINRIDVSGNDQMGEDGFAALGEIVSNCEVKLLDVSECNPSPTEVESFMRATHNAKITKLNFSRNRSMGELGLRCIGALVGKCQINELFIRQCELEIITLRSFKEGLGNSKIPILDFGLYFMKPRKTTDEEIEIFVEILQNVTEKLTLNAWIINARGRTRLREALNNLPYTGMKIVFNRGRNEFICQGRS